MAVNVQATFKKESRDLDGLGAISDQLVGDPLRRRLIIAEVEVTRITKDIREGGIETPTVRWTSVEVMHGDDELDARRMRDKAYSERTGQASPPPTLFDPPADDDRPWPGDHPDQPQDPESADGTIRQGRNRR